MGGGLAIDCVINFATFQPSVMAGFACFGLFSALCARYGGVEWAGSTHSLTSWGGSLGRRMRRA
jgi:hypothetical protein